MRPLAIADAVRPDELTATELHDRLTDRAKRWTEAKKPIEIKPEVETFAAMSDEILEVAHVEEAKKSADWFRLFKRTAIACGVLFLASAKGAGDALVGGGGVYADVSIVAAMGALTIATVTAVPMVYHEIVASNMSREQKRRVDIASAEVERQPLRDLLGAELATLVAECFTRQGMPIPEEPVNSAADAIELAERMTHVVDEPETGTSTAVALGHERTVDLTEIGLQPKGLTPDF